MARLQLRTALPICALLAFLAGGSLVVGQRLDGGVRLNGTSQGNTFNNTTFTGTSTFTGTVSSTNGYTMPSGALLTVTGNGTAGAPASGVWQFLNTAGTGLTRAVFGTNDSSTTTGFALSQGGTTNITLTSGDGSTRLGLLLGNLGLSGTVGSYNGITTAGQGLVSIPGYGRSTGQTAAVASVATYTVGAADASFEVSANANVTTSTTHSFSLNVTYTDEGNTSRLLVLPVAQLAGSFVTSGLITNVTGAGPYESAVIHIRAKAATAITISTSAGGTYTTVTYNVEGTIKRTAP